MPPIPWLPMSWQQVCGIMLCGCGGWGVWWSSLHDWFSLQAKCIRIQDNGELHCTLACNPLVLQQASGARLNTCMHVDVPHQLRTLRLYVLIDWVPKVGHCTCTCWSLSPQGRRRSRWRPKNTIRTVQGLFARMCVFMLPTGASRLLLAWSMTILITIKFQLKFLMLCTLLGKGCMRGNCL